jgi:predicted component of type VI protein secretion system
LADICLLGEPSISSKHAEIICSGGNYSIKAVDGEITVNRQGKPQSVSGEFALNGEDLIHIGSVRAQFNLGG